MLDVSKILSAIEKGVSFAEELTPLIAVIPGAGPILSTAVNAAGAITDVVTNVQQRVSDGEIVMNTTDQSKLQDYISRLQKVNDDLAEQVDAS